MSQLHQEAAFEAEICDDLAARGWLYAAGDAAGYDRARALFPADVTAWVRASQPQAWAAMEKTHGAAAEETLLIRLRDTLNQRGTLDTLRLGVDVLGLRKPVDMAQFRPAHGLNPEITARYAANRLRVVRQVRYSQANGNSIDLVLFLNGIPVATAELKSDFTQNVEDAVDQYRFDRRPRPPGQAAEPLLGFPSGALVHFAVSQSEVRMTTCLEGKATQFLPFNLGNNGGAGNPPNPQGYPTAYLWQQVWEPESWLEILGRYLVAQRDKNKNITRILFPRYHQLDATRKLRQAILAQGVGSRYLIQHSAGSGKTNSIAWTAHQLADLHDAQDKKMFDSVLVVSDRNVIDKQLKAAISAFERTKGVVAIVTGEDESKSNDLAEALDSGKKIVVCTIQTFPFAIEKVRELAATQNKRFAVIADEAHSSQTGSTAANLREVLSTQEWEDLKDEGEVSTEDLLAANMQARALSSSITYVAFTATPKAKTLEIFGQRPRPNQPAGEGNLPQAFHVYSMRQAIEEKFILDVLQNYTPYSLAFKLATEGKEWDNAEVEKKTAMKAIMRWVRLHPHNISQKVQVVVEHFREMVAPLLEGRAKAMVVLSSRLETVRWQLAIKKYIQDQGYSIGTLAAFSGEVSDPDSGPNTFSETNTTLNPALRGRNIGEAFATEEFHILLVANKFQTGFDQPLLCGMYVNKPLGGIQAVQTLSRLNRARQGKDTTYILDFINDTETIRESFQPYYNQTDLEDVTDPNLVFTLRAKLDTTGYYDEFEVNRVVEVLLKDNPQQKELVAAITPVADRLLQKYLAAWELHKTALANKNHNQAEEAKKEMEVLLLFKKDMGTYNRAYAFLSQIFDYGSTEIEKRFLFFKKLIPLLDFGREREGVDLSKVVLTHYKLKNQGSQSIKLSSDESPGLPPTSEAGSGGLQEKEKALLSEIIQIINELFEGDVSEGDKLSYVTALKGKLLESPILIKQAENNSKEQFLNSPDLLSEFMNAVLNSNRSFSDLYRQTINSDRVKKGLLEALLGPGMLYEALKEREQKSL